MRTGKIKFFNKEKKFGFIEQEGGDVFFHFDSYRSLFLSRIDASIFFKKSGVPSRFPEKGEIIAFDQVLGHRGPKAISWTFGHVYDKALECSEAERVRLNAPVRVMRQNTVVGNEPDESKVVFHGTLKTLNEKHPKPSDRRCDDLAPYFSSGDFNQRIWFESVKNGSWVDIEDPRTVVDMPTFQRMRR